MTATIFMATSQVNDLNYSTEKVTVTLPEPTASARPVVSWTRPKTRVLVGRRKALVEKHHRSWPINHQIAGSDRSGGGCVYWQIGSDSLTNFSFPFSSLMSTVMGNRALNALRSHCLRVLRKVLRTNFDL